MDHKPQIMVLVNRAFSSCDQNRFAIDEAGQLVLMNLQSVARISGVQCPWVIKAPHYYHVSIKTEILNDLHTVHVEVVM